MHARNCSLACASLLGILFAVAVAPPAVAGAAANAPAAPEEPIDLTATVAGLDGALFDAFNAHQLDRMMGLFAEDLEFYHDKGGLQTWADVKAGFEKMFASNNGIRRELVPGTVEVYPIPSWGALEEGSHEFCHVEDGKTICGTFKFVILWRQGPSGWKAARVMSYGH